MKYVKIVMSNFFASAFGCFLMLGATNEDFVVPAIVVFIAWLTLLILMIFDDE